jgi:hypothetical protein
MGGAGEVEGQAPNLRGEASLSGVLSDVPGARRQFLARYLPELSYALSLSGDWTADVTVSPNFWISRTSPQRDDGAAPPGEDLEPYRAWLRVSKPRFEARAGLQRISFGSASVLRPLMWFDRLDPRDPLQLTEGVWAVLGRAYLPGNATVWAWAVRGEDDRRGWDLIPGAGGRLEGGGRVQVALGPGEVAASFHHRRLDLEGLGLFAPGTPVPGGREDRFGIDGKWDVEVGVWVEAEMVRQDSEALRERWLRGITVGADYTFKLGNGLTVLGEHMVKEAPSFKPLSPSPAPGGVAPFSPSPAPGGVAPFSPSPAPGGPGEGPGVPSIPTLRLTAITAGYPLGVLDRVGLAVYRDWEGEGWFRLLEWRRTYDSWRIHLLGFWNPDVGGLFPSDAPVGAGSSGSLAGKGAQLILVFNH